MTFGERLKLLRKEHGLTQEELAKIVGLSSKHAISKYEKNGNKPGFDVFSQLMKYFGVSAAYLRGESEYRQLSEEIFMNEVMNMDERLADVSEALKKKIISIMNNFYSILDDISNDRCVDGNENTKLYLLERLYKSILIMRDIYFSNYLPNSNLWKGEVPNSPEFFLEKSKAFDKYIQELKEELTGVYNLVVKKLHTAYVEEYSEVKARPEYLEVLDEIYNQRFHSPRPAETKGADEMVATSDQYSTYHAPYKHQMISTRLDHVKGTSLAPPIVVFSGSGKTSYYSELVKRMEESKTSALMVSEEVSAYVPHLRKVAAGRPIDLIENRTGLNLVFGIKDVDFTLQIDGDSMDPEFPDRSIVFVRKQEVLENGEVGIIMIGDQVTCKKFYRFDDRVELRSINKKFDPMVYYNGDFRILGKVIKLED